MVQALSFHTGLDYPCSLGPAVIDFADRTIGAAIWILCTQTAGRPNGYLKVIELFFETYFQKHILS